MPTTLVCIREGTLVYSVMDKLMVKLAADVYTEAVRHDDGEWGYCVGGRPYAVAGGLAEIVH